MRSGGQVTKVANSKEMVASLGHEARGRGIACFLICGENSLLISISPPKFAIYLNSIPISLSFLLSIQLHCLRGNI